MVRQNLSIYEVEEKETRNGNTMWTIKTNKGSFSVFDEDIANELIEGQGRICDVEVTEKKKGNKTYKNITAFNGAYGEIEKEEIEEKKKEKTFDEERQESIELASKNKLKSIAVGYAHQLACAEITALIPKTIDLNEAILLTKKIEEEINKTAHSFYNLIVELDKEPEKQQVKQAQETKQENETTDYY